MEHFMNLHVTLEQGPIFSVLPTQAPAFLTVTSPYDVLSCLILSENICSIFLFILYLPLV
jgi:hypothetical protein